MLYLVGLGLGSERDITLRGLDVLRKCKKIYLEHYTAILDVDVATMEALYQNTITLADREFVEGGEQLLDEASSDDVALLVVGDPFGATTHTDLVLRATERGIAWEPIHNCSIMNAVGCTGLQLYSFGQTVSIVFFDENWRPDSFFDRIEENIRSGLHSLLLLDIKVKEQSKENMARGILKYEPPRYMTVSQCCLQLVEVSERRVREWNEQRAKYVTILACEDAEERALDLADWESELPSWIHGQLIEDLRCGATYAPLCTPKSIAVGLARVAQHTHPDPNRRQRIAAGTISTLSHEDMGPPLHTVVVPGRMHELEARFLAQYAVGCSSEELLHLCGH